MVIDGSSGTLDPAFDAHVLPIVRYAYAWWESWQPAHPLTKAFGDAYSRLIAKNMSWGVVNGPIAALIMSLLRMKWSFIDSMSVTDDLGRVYKLTCDPPCVLASAMKESVRRWRIAKILVKYPSCAPSVPDYADPRLEDQWVINDGLLPHGIVDLIGPIGRLAKGSRRGAKSFEPWEPKHAPSLISAFTGGQWCQGRVASTKAWTDHWSRAKMGWWSIVRFATIMRTKRENAREVPSAAMKTTKSLPVLSCRLRATKLLRVVRTITPVMLIAPHPSQSACLCLSTLR